MRLRTAVAGAALAAICGTAVVSGASAAAAAAKPKTWTVEYSVGNERIFVTYEYPQPVKTEKTFPLVLSRSSAQGVVQRDLTKDLHVYRKVTTDSVSVLVLVPCPPHMRRHHCHHRLMLWPIARLHWKHLCLQTGFGGAARSVSRHHPENQLNRSARPARAEAAHQRQ